jgi:hypothetical protein
MMTKTNCCPNCNYIRIDFEFSTCPFCGIIVEKYYAAKEKKTKMKETTIPEKTADESMGTKNWKK